MHFWGFGVPGLCSRSGRLQDYSNSKNFWPLAAVSSQGRGCTIGQTSFNIVKNIVGEGMLSLPGALAAGTGMFPGH